MLYSVQYSASLWSCDIRLVYMGTRVAPEPQTKARPRPRQCSSTFPHRAASRASFPPKGASDFMTERQALVPSVLFYN